MAAIREDSGSAKPRLIVVDDHRMVVEGFCSVLAPHYQIVGTAHGGEELLELLKRQPADCLLLDLQLQDRCGLDVLPDVRALQPELRILVVTMFLDRCLADAALSGGAHGFIPKDASLEELRHAIGEVLAGRRHVSPRVPRTSQRTSLNALHPLLHRLTPQQQKVFRLLGEGMRMAEIAEALKLQDSTINYHVQGTRRTLGLKTHADLVRLAVLVRACLDAAEESESGIVAGPTGGTDVPLRQVPLAGASDGAIHSPQADLPAQPPLSQAPGGSGVKPP